MTEPEVGQDMHAMTGWERIPCRDADKAREVVSGVSSALTDIDGTFGPAVIFTEWHLNDRPILRDYLYDPHTDSARCEHFAANWALHDPDRR